jgi:hypothetical protein
MNKPKIVECPVCKKVQMLVWEGKPHPNMCVECKQEKGDLPKV